MEPFESWLTRVPSLCSCLRAIRWCISGEVHHLAAGMPFAGFNEMIGPLWRVDDSIAHEVVTRFYREMFKSPVLDGEHVAETSNPTVVEASKEVPSERRTVFVHIRI